VLRKVIVAGASILIPDGVDDLITVAEAASLCGVSSEAIRKWASRGILIASGLDERGRKLYKVIDVAKAERATRDRARR
jgi:DNA-binding transcriptional MerR regulator